MKATRRAVLAACFALALPATALAQGAGDNQYQDPFGSDQGGGSQQRGAGSSGSGSQGTQGSSSSGSSSSASSGRLSGSPPGMSTSASATTTGRLPATGGEPVPLAALGTGLLLAGVGLRLRRPLG